MALSKLLLLLPLLLVFSDFLLTLKNFRNPVQSIKRHWVISGNHWEAFDHLRVKIGSSDNLKLLDDNEITITNLVIIVAATPKFTGVQFCPLNAPVQRR